MVSLCRILYPSMLTRKDIKNNLKIFNVLNSALPLLRENANMFFINKGQAKRRRPGAGVLGEAAIPAPLPQPENTSFQRSAP